MSTEDAAYKLDDYLARDNDIYTMTKYKIVMNWLPQKSGLNILNAGCGSGEMNILLSQQDSWQVEAIDVDLQAINLSQELKQRNCITNLKVVHSTIEEHQYSHPYDIIVSNDVLEHIKDDTQAVKKLVEMLTPQGTLCISVPAYPWLFGYHDEKLGHYRRYTRQDLLKILTPHFQIKKCRYFAASLIPVVLLYSCWRRKAYPVSDLGKKSWLKNTLDTILTLEAKIPLPVGISLIILATKK